MSAQSPPPDLPGFTYKEWIGGGGFADVFLFTQHSTKRLVAIKVLRSEHLSASGLEQFQTEADTMASVSAHPYIVTILDAAVAPDGRPFIVMEHYPQPHFGVLAKGGTLPLAEVLKVGVQVCSAVETAHRAGVIHRDIKPANILTSSYGDPGLTDFGIAGVQVDDVMSAAAGVTPGFAAPEVILDEQATGSRSSDVFSLGATIYALLTGRSPIYVPGGDNSPSALYQRAAAGTVLPLNREGVPRSLEHLLNSALSADPSHRQHSAASLAQALQDVEQELTLPPTKLVLVGTAASAPAPSRASDDEEATRRKVQVVDLDGAGPAKAAPPRSVGAEPGLITDAPCPMPGADTLDEFPTRARGAVSSEPSTQGRGSAHTVARKQSDPPNQVEPKAEPPKGPLPYLLGAGALLLLVGIIAVVLAGSGGGATSTASSTTSARPPSRQDPTSFGQEVGPPGNVTAAIDDAGTLTVSWEPPTQPSNVSADGFRYQVLRDDAGHDPFEFGPEAEQVAGASLDIPDVDVSDTDGVACVSVSAIAGDRISNPPIRSCGGSRP